MAASSHPSQVHPGLERKPGKQNWIENLPAPLRAKWHKSWIYRAAKHLHYDQGMLIGRAIAVAKNAAVKGCSTGDLNWPGKQSTNPASRAEMCSAVATWRAMRAASGSKGTVNMANDLGEAMLIDLAYISAKERRKAPISVKSKKAPGGRGYPIRNSQDVKDAEQLFKTHRKKYSSAKKKNIANAIRRGAKKHGVNVNLSNDGEYIINLSFVPGTRRPFNPNAVRRGFGGKFINKGAGEANEGATTVSFSSAMRSMRVGQSIDLPSGKGIVKRLKEGWQVRTGDGQYNKIFRDATEAVAVAGKIVRSRFAKGGGLKS